MLFSNNEIEGYKSFGKVASDLNIYSSYFLENQLMISILDKYSLNIADYMHNLKTIIIVLEGVIYENNKIIDEMWLSLTRDFTNKIHNNLTIITRDSNSLLKFIVSFLYIIESFLEELLNWNKYAPYGGSDENLNIFLSSELFNNFFDTTKKIIADINRSSDLNYKNVLQTFYRDFNSLSEDDKNSLRSFFENLIKSDDINNKVLILEDRINSLLKDFKGLENTIEGKSNKNFYEQKKVFEERANEALNSFKSSINKLKSQYQGELEPQVSDLTTKLSTHKSELDSLLSDVKLYQDKMTNKAVSEMSAHYFDKSKFERNSYFAITLISAIIIIFSVISAYKGVNSYYNEYVSTKSCDSSESRTIKVNNAKKEMSFEDCMKDLSVKREATQKYAFNYLIFRLSFSLLLFLAVIYASRIAMRAYNHWRQSENMYLKLNTLSPFIGSLDKSVRNDVHLSLVPDYFGKDAGIVENSKDVVKDLPTNISNIAIKAIEQAGSTISSKLGSDKESKKPDSESSTEKNKKKSEDESQ
ncbi:hypothetical protein K5E11_06305 [Acinetobacter pittii]|uniref:hypothetical protein n=1 Tax=Acinetobacter pittii TaxID=48296 RepID=UPI001FF59223|nr:hypothetical protein [Acinetobacter pittii]MCJ9040931.1 hypothetical protein [Acinetobacter pittii]HEE6562253.1 hypothetical protein [Acinetobacter baumannii]